MNSRYDIIHHTKLIDYFVYFRQLILTVLLCLVYWCHSVVIVSEEITSQLMMRNWNTIIW